MQYGTSTVGTEATTDRDHEISLQVLGRDDYTCICCGDEGLDITGETTLHVVKRNDEWRHVTENLYTACAPCRMVEDSYALANGWKVRSQYGVGDQVFLTHAGWRWLSHAGVGHSPRLLTERPRQREF